MCQSPLPKVTEIDLTNDVDADDIYNIEENEKIRLFLEKGCKCKLGNESQPCVLNLTYDFVLNIRCDMLELDSNELDNVLMMAIRTSDRITEGATHSWEFFVDGNQYCMQTFLFLHGVNRTRFYSVLDHYTNSGFVHREHGNKRRIPANAFTIEDKTYFNPIPGGVPDLPHYGGGVGKFTYPCYS